jgi:hypothetical protein
VACVWRIPIQAAAGGLKEAVAVSAPAIRVEACGRKRKCTCAPQNYPGGGQGPRIVKGFASGEVRGVEQRVIVPRPFYSSVRRCEVASSSTQSSSA